MPNHITNKLTWELDLGESKVIDKVFNLMDYVTTSVKNEEEETIDNKWFDFEKIVPKTKENTEKYWIEKEGSNLQISNLQEDIRLINGTLYCFDWYRWRLYNWDTKWNAYNCSGLEEGSDEITFDTAWSTPEAIIKALSIIHPNYIFRCEYADEDIGSNCGYYVFKNGELLEDVDSREMEYREALEWAIRVMGLEDETTVYTCKECGDVFYRYNDDEDFNDKDLCYECDNLKEEK